MPDLVKYSTFILVILCAGCFLLVDSSTSKPYIYLLIPVEPYSQAKVLPFALSGIEAQDYPKSQIHIHILFDLLEDVSKDSDDFEDEILRRNRATFNQIQDWSKSNKQSYRDIHMEITPTKWIGVETETSEGSGTPKYDKLSESVIGASKRAISHRAEYMLLIDANIILVNDSALSALVESKCPKLAENQTVQVSRSSGDQRKLIAHEILPESIKNEEKLENISERIDGSPFCILGDLGLLGRKRLVEIKTETLNNIPVSLAGLVQPVEKNDTGVSFTGNSIWGYLLQRDDGKGLEDMDLDLLDLEVKASGRGVMFPLSESMKPFVIRPDKDRLGVDQVYIINLKRRTDRHERMSKQMEILGIEAVFWDAVDGEELKQNASLLDGLHIMKGLAEAKALTYGQVGCFLSHYTLWEHSLKKGFESIIVLEDDTSFARNFKHEWNQRLESIHSYEELHESIDFTYLGRVMMKIVHDKPTEFTGLVKPGLSFCLHGYLIKRTGIEKIIEAQPLDKILPADWLIPILTDEIKPFLARYKELTFLFPNRTMKALSVEPLLVLHSFAKNETGHSSDNRKSELIKSGAILQRP